MIPPITPELLSLLKDFKRQHPWTGDLTDRKNKFIILNRCLNELFHKEVELDTSRVVDGVSSYNSYIPVVGGVMSQKIIMIDKLSVITYLHEYAHILDANEFEAQNWAIELYKQIFPKNFVNLHIDDSGFASLEVDP